MWRKFTRLLEVPTTDPDDARRRKLLNIILAGAGISSLTMAILTAIVGLLHLIGSPSEFLAIYISGGAIFVLAVGVYAVNRYISGRLASIIFLLMLSIALAFSDIPREVAAGRSLFVFVIPIVISSVLLRPYMTFLFALIGSMEISILAISIGDIPNLPAIIGYFLIALVSWLSARSLENALKELMQINKELDKRVIDRTHALSAALALAHAEAGRSQAILQGIADGVVVFDNSDKAIMVNPAIEPLVMRKSNDILGINLQQWLTQSDLVQREREIVLRSFQEPPSSQDGKNKVQWGKKTLAISVAPVRISSGEIIGKVAVFHDFTREAEVDRMKSDFVAMVSHELRTPLNSILGYADMLREGVYGKLEVRQVGIVERVMANTNKLLTIVNDLLDQAQIEAGRLSFHNRHFQPSELVDNVRAVMESLVQSKNLKLVLSISDEMPSLLYGDPQRLNQVLVNLTNNAVKFTEQGSIEVRLYMVDQEHWAMEVSDTGTGIPAEAQRYIFEPFRQVEMEVTRRPGGIGLGLSIVKRLVNMMQGEICLNSQVGVGSTFTVILPLKVIQKEMQRNE
jgi:signal transduction histidine kinase